MRERIGRSVNELLRSVDIREWPGLTPPQIELIYGSMFSGKTEELVRRVRRAKIAKYPVQVFKPIIDTRYDGIYKVNSHSGADHDAIPVARSEEIIEKLKKDTLVVAIDEAQFIDVGITDVCKGLLSKRIRVIVAGLMFDFKQDFFGPMPDLFREADVREELFAICTVCGEPANRTQRLINGQPPHRSDEVVVVGASETYEARCREHHKVLD